MDQIERYELAIVGTGFHGLSVARTYLQLNPSSSVVLFDTAHTPGGVWSEDRLYPGLSTQNHIGKYEFSDFPMEDAGFSHDSYIPARAVHEYLKAYAEKFDLVRRTQFDSKVEVAEQQGSLGWMLTVASSADMEAPVREVFTSKLVVAGGMNSMPKMPSFVGQQDFQTPLFHSKDYCSQAGRVKDAKSVVVLSGAKSAWDVVHSYASAGVQVDWVIRSSGHGPCYMAPNRVMGPFKVITETLINTRLVTWLSPCIWGDADGYVRIRRFLNRTALGRLLTKALAAAMQMDLLASNAYDSHPETAKLKPWNDIFWIGSSRGLLNYDSDIFALVRAGKIRVHIADITHLSRNTVHLSDGTALPTSALICCTGWKHTPPLKFTRAGTDIAAELGLPHFSKDPVCALTARADAEILSRFPLLADQPRVLPSATPLPVTPAFGGPLNQPYRLHRFMVPAAPAQLHARTLAFAGVVRNASTAWVAQAQALWIAAFFAGRLPHLREGREEEIMYDTVLQARFGRWRYPYGFGALFPDFFFDALPYVDQLLGELGVKVRRKGSWWREVFESYGPADYRGVVEEWVGKQGAVFQAHELSKEAGVKVEERDPKQRSVRQGKPWSVDALALLSWKSRPSSGHGFGGLLANVVAVLLLLSLVTTGVLALG